MRDALSSKNEIKLFKDTLEESGAGTTTSTSHAHRCERPIVFMGATSSRNASVSDAGLPNHDVIAVAADGTLMALHGETLESKWQSSPGVFTQELSSALRKTNFGVDFVQSALAADVIDGILGGSNELFGVFQEKVHRDGFNPDILIAISSTTGPEGTRQSYLHILALPEERPSRQANGQKVISVFFTPLPTKAATAKFQLDVKSGTLQELSDGTLHTYVFKSGIPRLENKLSVPGMGSFIRLSKTSVLAASATSLSVYNPVYRSLQAATSLASVDQPKETGESNDPCELVMYLPSRETAVALRGSSLIAIQIEAPASRGTKRRAEGLLVDAIRRGIPREEVHGRDVRPEHVGSVVLAEPLPGLLSEVHQAEWLEKSAKADELLRLSDLQGFEGLLAGVFGVRVDDQAKLNGTGDENGVESEATTHAALAKWAWLGPGVEYPRVDRRWVLYAIQKVFAWNYRSDEKEGIHLECVMPDSNVLGYLVAAGHLSTSNFKSAFKQAIQEVDGHDNILGEELPPVLVEADPTMELLIGYLAGTQLGATELTAAIKLLLRSLDLLEDPSKRHGARLTGATEQEDTGDNDDIAMELDRAEEELKITEYYLGSDSGSRARGLSVAFSKLAACPAIATVQSLRRMFKPEETISLMNVLRMELIKDGWTTRYLDRLADDEEESEAAPDGSIQLIADLLCRCLDSVGLGGWLAFDDLLANGGDLSQDSVDFFGQFQAEISAALEGIWEVVRLQSTLADAVEFAKRSRAEAKASNLSKGSIIRSQLLPFGLKTEERISLDQVKSGGEIVHRSSRQIGQLQSQKRKAYGVMRISEETLMGRQVAQVMKEEGL